MDSELELLNPDQVGEDSAFQTCRLAYPEFIPLKTTPPKTNMEPEITP